LRSVRLAVAALAFLDKMPRVRDQLTAGEWAMLALLAEEPTHGFAIARAMAPDGEIGKVWSLPRPRVYYAIDALTVRGFAGPVATVASHSGPHRTVLEVTPPGRRALGTWLAAPVEHVRDARSLLLLKLLFLDRSDLDPGPLLRGQRLRFESLTDRLLVATAQARGFDQTVLSWRLESATAAVRFIDAKMNHTL
jgi:DNA-binding PadR family transcriptional regulator